MTNVIASSMPKTIPNFRLNFNLGKNLFTMFNSLVDFTRSHPFTLAVILGLWCDDMVFACVLAVAITFELFK